MISAKELIEGTHFRFNHIKCYVIEKTPEGKVLVFGAAFVDSKLPGESMSKGLIEINKTLWDQSSTKRPKGYFMISSASSVRGNLGVSIFIAEEWMDRPKMQRTKDEKVWAGMEWLPA